MLYKVLDVLITAVFILAALLVASVFLLLISGFVRAMAEQGVFSDIWRGIRYAFWLD